eukprot:8186998-Lingulodinium_polyedra.AAC.1
MYSCLLLVGAGVLARAAGVRAPCGSAGRSAPRVLLAPACASCCDCCVHWVGVHCTVAVVACEATPLACDEATETGPPTAPLAGVPGPWAWLGGGRLGDTPRRP